MRFYPLASEIAADVLNGDYKAAREIGCASLGETCLYFKSKLKVNYIPYKDMTRAFRRVQMVQTKMCCGRGDLQVENVVICGAEGAELAQIQLPGARAGIIMLEELEKKAEHIQIGKPSE